MVTIIIVLVIVGVVMWLVENYVPLSEPFRIILRVVVVLALCIWLLSLFGIVSIPTKLR